MKKIVLFLPIFILGIVFYSYLALTEYGIQNKDSPTAINGYIDFTNWDFQRQGLVYLKGDWEFYWGKYYLPDDLKDKTLLKKYYKIPSLWNKELTGKSFNKYGYATYKLKIKMNKNMTGKIMAIKTEYINTTCKVWVNNHLMTNENGDFDERYAANPQLRYFSIDNEEVEIVIQVSNQKHRKGGIGKAILFGEEKHQTKDYILNLGKDLFLIGAILIMAFYHFGLYFYRKDEKAYLYFALFCLAASIRGLSTGQDFINIIFPILNFEYTYKIEYISFFLCLGFGIRFSYCIFKEVFNHKIMASGTYITYAFSFVVLFTNVAFYSNILNIFQILTLIYAAYMLYGNILSVISKKKGSRILLFGNFIIILTVFNDILNNEMLLFTGNLFHIGFYILILSQSMFLASNFAKVFNDTKILSEKLLSIDKMKDDFLANTTHELKTPLNGIIGIAESLIDGIGKESNEVQRKNLKIIIDCGKRLSSLVNDILDLEKLKKSKIELHIQNVNVRLVTESVINISKVLIKEKDIDIINNVDKDAWILGDEQRIFQILQNLIGNAIKFTKKGKIWISSRTLQETVEIEVGDTGIGIPKEKYKEIFEEFTQLDSKDTRHYSGTGIGLSITQKMVEEHGGRIVVKSEFGKGSSFIFSIKKAKIDSLPVHIAGNNFEIEEIENITTIMPDFNKIKNGFRILAVDDDIINLQILANYLVPEGFEIVLESDSRNVLTIIEKDKFDLLLLDIMMPNISGFEICDLIRKKYNMYDLPIFLLSAKNQDTDKNQGFRKGANDYITKPFEKNELINRVNTVLEIKKLSSLLIKSIKDYMGEIVKREEMEKEREKEKYSMMIQFSKGLVHEINTPISVIKGYISLFKKNIESLDHNMVFDIIHNETERIHEIGMQLLIFGDNKKGMYKFEKTNLTDFLENVIKDIEKKIDTNQIQLIKKMSENNFIEIDRRYMKIAISNILKNSFEAFDKEKNLIEIKSEKIGKDIIIKIWDNGKGLANEEMNLIFEPLYSSKIQSTGMGLTISKMIIDNHGGEILIKSQKNDWTEVIVKLISI